MVASGIYDAKGRLIKSTVDRLNNSGLPDSATNKDSSDSTPTSITGSVSGSSAASGFYYGNIVMRDNTSKVAVFIGIE